MMYSSGGRNQPPIAQPGAHVSCRPRPRWLVAMRYSQMIDSTMRAICAAPVSELPSR